MGQYTSQHRRLKGKKKHRRTVNTVKGKKSFSSREVKGENKHHEPVEDPGNLSLDRSTPLDHHQNTFGLPEEILLHFFHFLSVKHVLAVASTCKTWMRISENPALWRDLCLHDLGEYYVRNYSKYPVKSWKDLYKFRRGRNLKIDDVYFTAGLTTRDLFTGKEVEKQLLTDDAQKIFVKMRYIQNPHILKNVIDFFEARNNDWFAVLDILPESIRCKFKPFHAICNKYSEKEISKFVYQLLLAVECMHSRGIGHGGIGLENIFIVDGLLKVAEIDCMWTDVLGSIYQSINCVAPECLSGGYVKIPDSPADMWSVGAVAYLMLCGYPPFRATHNGMGAYGIYQNILRGMYDFNEHWVGISKSASDFVSKLLVVETSDRLSVVEALQHPWFSN